MKGKILTEEQVAALERTLWRMRRGLDLGGVPEDRSKLRPVPNEGRVRIHPEVEKISGLVPEEVDAEEMYREYLRKKHR